MHEDGRRWVGSNKVVELKKKREQEDTINNSLQGEELGGRGTVRFYFLNFVL